MCLKVNQHYKYLCDIVNMLRKSWARATKNLGIEVVVSKPGLAASDHGGTRCQLTSRVWRLGTELRRSPDFFSQGRILPSMYIYI